MAEKEKSDLDKWTVGLSACYFYMICVQLPLTTYMYIKTRRNYLGTAHLWHYMFAMPAFSFPTTFWCTYKLNKTGGDLHDKYLLDCTDQQL